MTSFDDVRCPRCAGTVCTRGAELVCERCGPIGVVEGQLLDLRVDRSRDLEAEPLRPGQFDSALRAHARGEPFKASLEALLLELETVPADRLMQLLTEGRGAWMVELADGGAELLFLGTSLSGAITPLAAAGWKVTVLETCAERARFSRWRDEEHSSGLTRTILVDTGLVDASARLPFDDARFDAVVHEDGAPGRGRWQHDLREAARVARGELLVIGDNRLAYKRSTGRRTIYYVPGPIEYARHAISRASGERTLAGYKKELARAGIASTRAFALYPHRTDYTHVVALDAPHPSLTVGPMEQKNRLKLAARSIGLFPVLAPSFAIFGARQDGAPARVERILDELARATGEARPELEQLVATRGNSAILHTRASDASESGRWTVHIPLSPKKRRHMEHHFASIASLPKRFPELPIPRALHAGTVAGVWLTCERRLSGWTAPQRAGDHARIARMLDEAAAHFGALVVREPRVMTSDEFEREVGARIDFARGFAAVPSTIAWMEELRARLERTLVGRRMPRVLRHSDLRAKHVQIDLDGRVLGYLDWGTAEDEALPYFDLLHLLVHERKQEAGLTTGAAWRIVVARDELRAHESAALERYRELVGLDDEVARELEQLYPAFVADMAETNWDYSRPRWLQRQFGIGAPGDAAR